MLHRVAPPRSHLMTFFTCDEYQSWFRHFCATTQPRQPRDACGTKGTLPTSSRFDASLRAVRISTLIMSSMMRLITPTPNSKKQSKYATSNVCNVQAQLQQHNSKRKSSNLHTACRSRSLASRPSPCPPASLGHLHLQHRDDHVQQHALPPPKRLFLLCHRESRPLRLCFY